MKTYIIIDQKNYFRTNYHEYYDKNKMRFVFILNDRYYNNFPKSYFNLFDEIIHSKIIDFDNVKFIVEDIIKKYGKEETYIISTKEDNVLLASQLRTYFDLDGPKEQFISKYRDKILMKNILKNSNIRVPLFVELTKEDKCVNNLKEKIEIFFNKWPLVLKPVIGEGSYDTYIVHSFFELENIIKNKIYNISEYEIEEFIEGTMYHCDTIIYQNHTEYVGIGKYFSPRLEILNNNNSGGYILKSNDLYYKDILDFNKKILSILKPNNICTHLELFITTDGELIFLEIAHRGPGGDIPHIHKLNSNIDFNKNMFLLSLKEPPQINIEDKNMYFGWIHFPLIEGKCIKIKNPPIDYTEIINNINIGDFIDKPNYISEIAGKIFITSNSASEIENKWRNINDYQHIEVT